MTVSVAVREVREDGQPRPNLLSVLEVLPDGWRVESTSPESSAFSGDSGELLWLFAGDNLGLAYSCEGGTAEGQPCDRNLDCRCPIPGECPVDDSDAMCVGRGTFTYRAQVAEKTTESANLWGVVEAGADTGWETGGDRTIACSGGPVRVRRSVFNGCLGGEPMDVEVEVVADALTDRVVVEEEFPVGWTFLPGSRLPDRYDEARGTARWILDGDEFQNQWALVDYSLEPHPATAGERAIEGRVDYRRMLIPTTARMLVATVQECAIRCLPTNP